MKEETMVLVYGRTRQGPQEWLAYSTCSINTCSRREGRGRQLPQFPSLSTCSQCLPLEFTSHTKTDEILLTRVSGRDLGTAGLRIPQPPPLVYKHSPLYHGRMWHDQAPAYLYRDDFQPLGSYPRSWDTIAETLKCLPFLLTRPRSGTSCPPAWEHCRRTPTHLAALSWSTAPSPPESSWIPLPFSSLLPILSPSRAPALLGPVS